MAKGLKIIFEIDPVAQKLYGSFTMGKSDSPMRPESDRHGGFQVTNYECKNNNCEELTR